MLKYTTVYCINYSYKKILIDLTYRNAIFQIIFLSAIQQN